MAMVKITNGHRTFEVSMGAYESVYKDLGFRKVGVEADESVKKEETTLPGQGLEDTEPPEDEGDGENEGVNEDDGLDIEALLEKPLSQWTSDELKEFVRVKDIDITGATKVSQVRGIVKKYLEEQSKNG